MGDLTPKLIATLRFMAGYAAQHQCAPTLQEIADHFGITKVTTFERVSVLERKGYIQRDKNRTRAIRFCKKPIEALGSCPCCGRDWEGA